MAQVEGNRLGQLLVNDDLLICEACGTQYDVTSAISLDSCRICDDPRAAVPRGGQRFMTLRKYKEQGFFLSAKQDEIDKKIWSITNEPKVGIGQHALLIQTPHGNILWDTVAYLDEDGVEKINKLGGLAAIVISHPHFYTSWVDWSSTFRCPVYVAAADEDWLSRTPTPTASLRFLTSKRTSIVPGVNAIVCGGHFPGSTVLHTAPPNTLVPTLFHADTMHTVPSAHNAELGKPGVLSYTFMWAVPNMIPMHPDQILAIWHSLKRLDIQATYGVGPPLTIRWKPGQVTLPERILQSAQILIKYMGHENHAIFRETIPGANPSSRC